MFVLVRHRVGGDYGVMPACATALARPQDGDYENISGCGALERSSLTRAFSGSLQKKNKYPQMEVA